MDGGQREQAAAGKEDAVRSRILRMDPFRESHKGFGLDLARAHAVDQRDAAGLVRGVEHGEQLGQPLAGHRRADRRAGHQIAAQPLEEREPVNVNKENFAAVMADQKLSAEIQVPNHVSSDAPDAEMNLKLEFNSLADFRPEGIVGQVDELRQLKELRDALKYLKGTTANVPSFIRRIQDLMKDPSKRERLMRELGIDEKTT